MSDVLAFAPPEITLGVRRYARGVTLCVLHEGSWRHAERWQVFIHKNEKSLLVFCLLIRRDL